MRSLAVLVLLLESLVALGAVDLTVYDNSHVLKKDAYTMYWNVVGDELHLALAVNTVGWIGFGIGETTSGSMPGADIVTGFVSDSGEAQIQDRYATAKELPDIDTCQSWDLVNAEEADGHTVIAVKRKLNTGDLQDRHIQSGTVRIIWAYGTTDTVVYHEGNRGAVALVLYGDSAAEIPNSPDIQTLLLANNNFPLPTTRTYYQEQAFPIDLPQDAHIVAVEHVIDPNTAEYLHHFIMRGAIDVNGTDAAMIWGWAPGVTPLVLPPQAGYRIGPGAESYKLIEIQTHFDNPNLVPGLLDNSGIRIYYTFNLRENDASVLEMGDPAVRQKEPVHKGTGTESFEYNCPAECTSQWPHAINVFADTLHMHQIGAQMWSTRWRNGEFVDELNRIDFYDFGFQQQTPKSLVIEPGDRIQTHCIFNRGAEDVPFGLASDQEMCIEYLSYWPKMSGRFCSFIYISDAERNFTLCGSGLLDFESYNPTVLDPTGGEVIQFGGANDASYMCPSVTTVLESIKNTVDSSAAAPTGLGSILTLFALAVFTIFLH